MLQEPELASGQHEINLSRQVLIGTYTVALEKKRVGGVEGILCCALSGSELATSSGRRRFSASPTWPIRGWIRLLKGKRFARRC